jgi:hypothetical protein
VDYAIFYLGLHVEVNVFYYCCWKVNDDDVYEKVKVNGDKIFWVKVTDYSGYVKNV